MSQEKILENRTWIASKIPPLVPSEILQVVVLGIPELMSPRISTGIFSKILP